jgi:hypothetical protein
MNNKNVLNLRFVNNFKWNSNKNWNNLKGEFNKEIKLVKQYYYVN